MRADRLMAILLILQREGLQTAPQLAQRLEVSERTILRDMDALCASGVPVYAERGPHGGFRLADGYRIDLTGMRSPEFRTLFLRGLGGILSDLGWEHDAQTAREKLMSAVPKDQRMAVDEVAQRFYIDDAKWFSRESSSPWLRVLQDAIWANVRLEMSYRTANGETSMRLVSPLALVAKAGVWYLVAERQQELRVYRVDRIVQVTTTKDRFERPPSFHLEEFWKTWTQRFVSNLPRYDVLLWIEERAFPTFVRRNSFPYERIDTSSAPEGYVGVRVTFETIDMACVIILAYDFQVFVVEPIELRIMVTDRARQILQTAENLSHRGGDTRLTSNT
ncbi:MAG: YafY family transcriptional regulator [Alicyclobacillus sp.]|nr:YafY family transcriptional regulator [Alicyclobacillus sp.]